MRLTRNVILNTIAFMILSAFLIVVFAAQILPTVVGSTYTIFGIFPEAGGVFTNQEVTYRGVQIGRVGEMTLTRDAVKIAMIIDSENRVPKDGTRARVLFKSAVGEQFIDLLPEKEGPPYFDNLDTIPGSLTSIPIQTEDLLRDLEGVLATIDPQALATVVNELGEGLRDHGQDLRDLILALDTLAQIGANNKDLIASGVTAGANVQSSFNQTREDFVAASQSLKTVAAVLAKRRAQVGNTLTNTELLDREILLLLRNRKAELNQVIADAATATRLTHQQLDDLDKTLVYLGPMLGDVYKAYSAPYFMFNLLGANPEQPACSYSPSSRPVRAVTDSSFKEPQTNFKCPAGTDPLSARTRSVSTPASAPASATSPFTEIELKRTSWLRIYTLD